MTRTNPIAAAGVLTAAAVVTTLAIPVALHAQRPTTLAGRSTVYAPNAVVA